MLVAGPVKAIEGSAGVSLSEQELLEKVLEQGVPEQAFWDLQNFRSKNLHQEFTQDTYVCKNKTEADVKPCPEKDRTPSNRRIKIPDHSYAIIIDYSRSSIEERLFLIHLRTGLVRKFLVTHGKGSGNGGFAYKFSNVKDSQQTSLGIYMLGEVYEGSYGATMRMYGLEKSNDQAYRRDIVMHGAWYADRSFMTDENPNTKRPYGRLGVSWGCPAVSPAHQKELVPLLREGALIYHYHPELQVEARWTGEEVRTRETPFEYILKPKPRPLQTEK